MKTKEEVDLILKIGKERIEAKPVSEMTTEELNFLALMKVVSLLEPEKIKEKKIAHRFT